MLAERGMMSCEEVRVGSRETASMVEEAQVVVSGLVLGSYASRFKM